MTRLLSVKGATCAWGRHTEPAVMDRFHPDLGWLTCCQRHLTASLNVPVIAVKPCTVCRRTVRIRIDGRWPRHRELGSGGPWCPAAGLEATPATVGKAA